MDEYDLRNIVSYPAAAYFSKFLNDREIKYSEFENLADSVDTNDFLSYTMDYLKSTTNPGIKLTDVKIESIELGSDTKKEIEEKLNKSTENFNAITNNITSYNKPVNNTIISQNTVQNSNSNKKSSNKNINGGLVILGIVIAAVVAVAVIAIIRKKGAKK